MLEKFIFSNLDVFIVENDLNETYSNIKNFSKDYAILYGILYEEFNKIYNEKDSEYLAEYIIEGEILDKLKFGSGLFFKNLKDVFFNTALSKKFGLTTSGIIFSNFLSKYSISNTVMPVFGFSPTSVSLTGEATNLLTAGVFSTSLFFLLLIGGTIYKLINTSSVVLIKNYEEYITELISDLKRLNPSLSEINSVTNKIYGKLMDENCSDKVKRKEMVICGTYKYLELNSNVILPEIFKGYFKYLLSKNIKIDYINSAAELFYYKGVSDRVTYYMNKTYDKYNEIFDNIIPSDTEFKSKCIKSLNSKCNIILRQELKNATIN